MIVYSSTRAEFTRDVQSNVIDEKILSSFRSVFGRSAAESEIRAWKNSMLYMNNALDAAQIAQDAGVAIEYTIPPTAKRVDFIVTGRDRWERDTAVIVELKQWKNANATTKDGIVETALGPRGRLVEVAHPSYQAWSYAQLLRDFNEEIQSGSIHLAPCAYLHNCPSPSEVLDPFYREHIARAPAFLKRDEQQLQRFIQKNIQQGDSREILRRIEEGKIRPSKNLADHLAGLLKGNREFLMIDDQKVVYETALELLEKTFSDGKQVLIVEGGPGTGKSVVAVNLLVESIQRDRFASYVTRNAAPRHVYESKLTGTLKKTRISSLFKSSGAFIDAEEDCYDMLIVDEAHRLNEKSGIYRNVGENQIKEVIGAARCAVFFIDEDQRVTMSDVGRVSDIERWADDAGATAHRAVLSSQFRCNGSDGYLAWLDSVLQIRDTAHLTLQGIDFDFRVFDDPNELYLEILTRNQERNKARLVAGYCWDWKGKKDENVKDVKIPEFGFEMRWNLDSDGSLWIVSPDSVSEVGCIHTCQGLELDYVGVIIGRDFVVRDGRAVTSAEERSRQDSSVRGYKKLLREDPDLARARADEIVKNTYRTLMTRGQKGCYVFCVDPETNEYFKRFARPRSPYSTISPVAAHPGLQLKVMTRDVAMNAENAVPMLEFNDLAEIETSDQQMSRSPYWVEVPEEFRARPQCFVARISEGSTDVPWIAAGAWCLFRAAPKDVSDGSAVIIRQPGRGLKLVLWKGSWRRADRDGPAGGHCVAEFVARIG